MSITAFVYKVKKAGNKDIFLHLSECNDSFYPRLTDRINLEEYSEKISSKSVTFECWYGNKLAGLIASYFNDPENISGYISSVSVSRENIGAGIAKELIKMCIEYGKQMGFKEIKLEVHNKNEAAINLYRKYGFYNTGLKKDFIMMKKDL